MKSKLFFILICGILQMSCASFLNLKNSKFTSEKIELGMDRSDFLKLYGEPYAKEMRMDGNNCAVEHLLYQESLYDIEWYTLTTAFIFQNGKLVGQEVVSKEYVNTRPCR